MTRKLALALVACALFDVQPAAAQQCTRRGEIASYDLSDSRATLLRMLTDTRYSSDSSSNIIKSTVRHTAICLDSLPFLASWTDAANSSVISAAPASAQLIGNSAFPRSMNDGALWAGKGLNARVSAGVEGKWKWFSYAVLPEITYAQNADYRYSQAQWVDRSSFANAYHNDIDNPERFGDASIRTFEPGQSFIRADVGAFGAALSTENLWLSPAQFFPIMMGNNAAGFPHMSVGTNRPVDLKILTAEINIFFGSVSESDYFDVNPNNDNHFFTGTSLVIQPKIARGLHLGIARLFHDTATVSGKSAGFFVRRVIESPLYTAGGNRAGNAIGALFFRWVAPAGGLEAYGEWTREDTPFNAEDIVREPDWASAWGAGVQKVFRNPKRFSRLYGEVVHLGASAATARGGRGPYSTYTNSQQTHGHTNRGQVLGSPTGVGSDAQRVGWDMFERTAQTGAWLERVRYDDDAYYVRFVRRFGEARHDVEMTGGVRRVQMVGPVEVSASLILSRRYDRDFVSLEAEEEPLRETNVGTMLGIRWRPQKW